ncbi:class I SAM-dependent DNA methyltransferase [Pseudaestuariivita sp.]|uniref:class I SAM-dependent DNA methyltransferase n=1 Tax=Pseudaestuariivita sp. TaxID=2211669 RepID=UPI004059D16A
MSDAETIAVYDARAAEYADRFMSDKPGAQLLAFIALLPPGGRVLDLGCGPGTSAVHMARAGFTVDATDASAKMVRMASAQQGVTAWQAGFSDLDADALYDGVWANFALLHAPRVDMDTHLAAIRRALKPGGVLHIGMKTGDGTARDAIGRQYTYYTAEDLTARLGRAGFSILDQATGHEVGLSGSDDPWVILRARAIG